VALGATFRGLSVCLHHLHDALNALLVTLGEKTPADDSALADGIETVVLDMMGTLHEARTAAVNARKAVGHPVHLDRARRALTTCQERFHRIEQQFASDLTSPEAQRVGETRGRAASVVALVKRGEAGDSAMPPAPGTSRRSARKLLAGIDRAPSVSRWNRAGRGGPIELEQMDSAAAPLAVYRLYAGRYLQRRSCV
jgi:hypothetical protein